ncbi:39S ribosomal protein L21, mitochondrial [Lingula anatina]|uniref:Large ribosomal subunit protein bL21m n=1 Tax=Lingula anatina TaxID=7574 RepID=A0A1S3K367_LINAN|nr:39S ribosomal protein L21, mitochondrial [Lingula anatina]|eukprot:XP_013416706.1 39S ribosomal protein L21, mitochondrial [Lingula anatina]
MSTSCASHVLRIARQFGRLNLTGSSVAGQMAYKVAPVHPAHCKYSTSSCHREKASTLLNSKLNHKEFSTAAEPHETEQKDEEFPSDIAVINQVDTELQNLNRGRLFAVVFLFGTQRKVTTEDTLVMNSNITANVGDRIRLQKVMMVGGNNFTLIGRPILSLNMVRVEATVIEKTLDVVKPVFKFKRRKQYRNLKLSRDHLCFLRINSIEILSLDQNNQTDTDSITAV